MTAKQGHDSIGTERFGSKVVCINTSSMKASVSLLIDEDDDISCFDTHELVVKIEGSQDDCSVKGGIISYKMILMT